MSGGTAGEPAGVVVHLSYERPADAVEWLCRVFGPQETVRMDRGDGDHLSMLAGPCGGMVVISGLTKDFKDWMRQRTPGFRDHGERPWPYLSHAISVHVPDVDKHHEQTRKEPATVLSPPRTSPGACAPTRCVPAGDAHDYPIMSVAIHVRSMSGQQRFVELV